ncbi:MAG TPA: GPW/gp25 family protein [Ferruginibacter sp.]|nr:GPW/gp25 family protein [Ferruginibacter sp.]
MADYLKLPLKFEQFFQKKKLDRCSLTDSIARNIHLLITTQLEENKQDDNYGSQFWDHDYDIHMTNSIRRDVIINSLKTQLLKYEKRLTRPVVEVNVVQKEYRLIKNLQLKRKVEITVKGNLLRNNEPFRFQTNFYIGPMLFD